MKKGTNGELLSDDRCLRYDFCKTREPYRGFVPLKTKIAAESRGKEAHFCSKTCRGTYNQQLYRERLAAGTINKRHPASVAARSRKRIVKKRATARA